MGKQTKKELKELLKQRQDDLSFAQNGYLKDKEYIELSKQNNEIQKRMDDIKWKWYEDNEGNRNAIREEIEELKKAIAYQGELNPLDYNEDIQQALKGFFAGTTSSRLGKLIWVSEDQRFCVLKMPSNTQYTGRFSGNISGPSEWFLVDVSIYKGGWSKHDDGVIYYREGGRWSKKFESEIKENVQNYILENLL
jgi:hypothetical protein